MELGAPDPRTDAALLAAARGGDETATEALLVRYAPNVVRFARRLCDDPVGADDVVQETLIAAMRGLRDVHSERAIPTWLYAVTRSFCIKARRRSKHAPAEVSELEEQFVASPAAGPDEAVAGLELSGALEQAMRLLDPRYREVLVLRDVEGLTAPEVAEVLHLDVGAVKSRLHRARASVRARIAPALSAGPGPSCPDVVERFSRYLEDDLGPAECAAMQEHVTTCASCNAACASLKRVVSGCHASGREVPADVVLRVRSALRGVVGRDPKRSG